jgi:hypothetical protein
MTENIHIPVENLDERLRELVPSGDTVLYTSRAEITKTGFGGDKKFGHLVVTDKGLAFRASKMGFMRAGVVSAAKGALQGYIPFSDIAEFQNKKDKIKIKALIPEKPGKKRGWELKVARCKTVDEPKDAFKQRKNEFASFVEGAFKKGSTEIQ